MKIFKLIKIVKNSWKELNKEQYQAKNQIKKAKEGLDVYNKNLSHLSNAYTNLSDIYDQLPKQIREDYIQKTLDLFKYGWVYPNNGEGKYELYQDRYRWGYVAEYRLFVNDLDSIYNDMIFQYKKHQYSNINRLYNDFLDTIDNFIKNKINKSLL